MAYQTILFDRSEGVGLVTLNRPDQLNAFTPKMLEELLSVFKGMEQDPEVRAILITGAGKAFCGGEDFKSRAEAEVQREPQAAPPPSNNSYYGGGYNPVPVSPEPVAPPVLPSYSPLNPGPPPDYNSSSNAPVNPYQAPIYGSPSAPQPPPTYQPQQPPMNLPQQKSMSEQIRQAYIPLIHQIRTIRKPVIAAVNGVAAGTGLGLALACDIRYASERARFIEVSARVGLLPGGGTAFFLPRLIGLSKALELAFNGDELNAQDAERLGLVSKVFMGDRVLEESRKVAVRLAKGPTRAIGLAKTLVYSSATLDLDHALDLEGKLMDEAVASEDYKEGLRAFLEKRSPNFKGR